VQSPRRQRLLRRLSARSIPSSAYDLSPSAIAPICIPSLNVGAGDPAYRFIDTAARLADNRQIIDIIPGALPVLDRLARPNRQRARSGAGVKRLRSNCTPAPHLFRQPGIRAFCMNRFGLAEDFFQPSRPAQFFERVGFDLGK